MSDSTAAMPGEHPAPHVPSHAELFLAFFRITLSGFGGTLPWTRRMFVEEKGWMTPEEFNASYALCQFLPVPNIVNLAAVFGSRMRGWTGAAAAWAGFLVFPFFLMVSVGALYAQYDDVDMLRRVLGGIAAAAAGLLIATTIKMAMPLLKGMSAAPLVAILTAFGIGVMRWPLVAVLAVLVPLSIALAWCTGR